MDMADLSALLGEEIGATTTADMWVVLPTAEDGSAGAGDLALLGEARRLADGLGCYVHAVIGDEAAAQSAIASGADRVHVTADATGYMSRQQPEFVLLPSTHNSLAAGLAQRLQAGLITDVSGPLAIEAETRALLAPHPVYGDEYSLDLAVNSAVKMATLDTRAAWRPLSKARIIVAAGRGVRDAKGFALAAELAKVLGAELAGDRSARDSDWVDEAHEVGVTAQEVAPELYVAVGIMGDTIHNAAISGARKVIAIHADPSAPIFKAADLGLTGEPKEVLTQLLAALKSGAGG
jgi:electron transfer flavoprotein alpha subunit